jgi:glycosyltransferase EpsH
MNSPLVSIIISAYNEEKYIQACIESCLKQTCDNIEVVVVNDGSTDSTSKIINQYYQKNHRLTLIELNKNLGKINGFNLAFKASSGQYIAIMGADDICYPHRVETSLKYMTQGCGMVCSDLDQINAKGQYIKKKIVEAQYGLLQAEDFLPENLIGKPKVYGGTIFIERQLAEKIFPLKVTLSHEDWYIPVIAALYSRISYCNQSLIAYRIHSQNTSSADKRKIYTYSQWFYARTRDISYYQELISLSRKFKIPTDIQELKLKLAQSLLLKGHDKLKIYFQCLPWVKGLKKKILFSLYLVPYLLYILAMLARIKRRL